MNTTEVWCFWNGCDEAEPTCWNVDQILDYYWNYWSTAMKHKFGEDVDLDPVHCVEDWVTVNWAWRQDD
jgi:hypothetical protein